MPVIFLKNYLKKLDSFSIKLVPTYFLIMLLTLILFSYYVINSIGAYLYNDERVRITANANTIASFANRYISTDNTYMKSDFSRFLNSINLDEKMRINVVNKDSVAIYDSQNNSAILGKVQLKESVMTALTGTEAFEKYKNDAGVDMVDVSVPISNDNTVVGVVNITYSADKITNYIDDISKDILILFVVISFLVGLIIFIISNFMTRRIVNFTKKIREMSDGILDERLEVRGNDEIAQLGAAFNNMSDKLEALEATRVQFVSDASHELKTPLSSIKLMADSIIQTPDISLDQVGEFLGDIVGEVDRLNRIVNKLLYITKMDSVTEKDDKRFELVNLKNMVSDIVKTLMPLAQNSGVVLEFSETNDLFVMADSDRLWEGIYNICDNAIKYTKEYGHVEISIKKEDSRAVISVKDNGVGISDEDMVNIFDRFYRVDKARARNTGGTGLGLAIALASIRLHGGDIEVKSELNIGSEFRIVLPTFEVCNDSEVTGLENTNNTDTQNV